MKNVEEEVYPLTHPQKRIWYTEQEHPDTSINNVGGIVQVTGLIDPLVLEQAINRFIEENDGVRIRLTAMEAAQYVTNYTYRNFPMLYFVNESELHDWAQQQLELPFPCYDSDLFQFARFEVAQRLSGYVVKLHHLIADGWSVSLMTDQIAEHYERLSAGAVAVTKKPSYLEWLRAEADYLNSERCRKNRSYWTRKLTPLPEDYMFRSAHAAKGRREAIDLEPELSHRIRQCAEHLHISLNSMFASLMILYLSKTMQQKEAIIGIPVLNRSGAKEKNTFGMFTSTMPLRVSIHNEDSIQEYMKKVNKELISGIYHQRYPFDLLVNDIQLKKNGYDRLFQVCVNTYNTKLHPHFNGMPVENLELYNGYQPYALQLVVKDWSSDGRLTLFYDYLISDFTSDRIAQMHRRMVGLMKQMIDAPKQPLAALTLLTEQERREQLILRNETEAYYPQDKTVIHLFEEQVLATPEKIAASDGSLTFTYDELNRQANQFAYRLRSRGIAAGELVGIMAGHSIACLSALLGVLKAGGAYVPIDPDYPQSRIQQIIASSRLKYMLVDCTDQVPPEFGGQVMLLDDPVLDHGADANGDSPASPDGLAYIIYTSGSTGIPKGVKVHHRGLMNYITWAAKSYLSLDHEVFALYSSLSFDLTVTSMFAPLISGHEVRIYRQHRSEFILRDIFADNQATVVKLTPAHLALIMDLDLRQSTVHCLIVGGDDLKASLAERVHHLFGGHIRIVNEYGPTETVVGCIVHEYDPKQDREGSVPIGQPIQNVKVYVLDQAGQPVPDEQPGELYIAGDSVGQGYLYQEELTEARFVADAILHTGTMYRTGDLACWFADGTLHYLGRVDHQVKIKGYRIESQEIENECLRLPEIREAVVIDREDSRGQKYLAAYIIPDREGFDTMKLRRHLIARLPSYMVPAAIQCMKQFPLTPNGKVDRNRLPDPLIDVQEGEKEAYTASGNGTEAAVLAGLKHMLSVDVIHPGDNFYFLGGDSIKAIQLSAQLREQGVHLTVKDILAFPVIRELLVIATAAPATHIAQTPAMGAVPCTPIWRWFKEQRFAEPHYYNQSVLLRLHRELPVERLRQALGRLVEHHDALRLILHEETGELHYCNERLGQLPELAWIDLSHCTGKERIDRLRSEGERLKSSMSLATGPLFKAALFDLGEQGRRLLLTAHHGVIDAVSWRIVLEDFSSICHALLEDETVVLPAKTHSYQAYAQSLEQYGASDSLLASLDYWEASETQRHADLGLAHQHQQRIPSKSTERTLELTAELIEDETKRLQTSANATYATTTQDLLLTALSMAVGQITHSHDVTIELEGHGRESFTHALDVTRTVGWFTTLFPVCFHPGGGDMGQEIQAHKEQLRRIPDKGLSYGVLRYLRNTLLASEVKDSIRFNYLGEIESELPFGLFSLAEEYSGADSSIHNQMTCGLDFLVWIAGGRLHIRLSCDPARYSHDSAEQLLHSFIAQLQAIIHHCENTKAQSGPAVYDTIALTPDELDNLFVG
ncbi:non-ribosomal peptide synthetase [Paenibacillus sp. SYP-B4298]|uniref:non-ribosomal peptide synthetase n=1 Tax=Paenibacillus sp. SYP-B4298 TaxID=2996034 RepID=UPI0022DE5FBF|nr:non-ribosomal peptide synthetase [Paenibacillus sp. SYP-B4298]